MKLYSHSQLKDTKSIITYTNNGITKYQISKDTGINKGKIRRCLDEAMIKTIKPNTYQPWKGPIITIRYDFQLYKNVKDQSKADRAYKYASHAEIIYIDFINFCRVLYETRILNVKVKRSADEFIKEFNKAHPTLPFPSRFLVYKMAKSHHYQFEHRY